MATFDYFGEEFSYAPEFPWFEYGEFHAARLDGDQLADAEATGYLLRLALACVAEEDQARFRRLSRKNRAKVPDYSVVIRDWTAEEAERPTGQPTGSSDGPTDTAETSGSGPVASVTPISSPEERPRNGAVALAMARSRAV